ncbi:hypothetical protein EXM36_01495 [Clostridium botulinum]|uniref:hypothetical protein n=1 Tax=Clostridium botulinum TaxID=1491 RepID=UPI0013763BF5|nr:hypothetical protein [Clostridium botulinum]MCC5416753.1 hypothetical protein [Clostridium botulinum]NCI18861.1 hypothetical protein [Clostridium botulinum]NCI34560.1 hypothetical protein [Clostridium botulinum]NCI71400.1 hypothetical protein [Clostridium botulinum]NDI37489.1 hypothetical protein [Clostridium botulinum]
MSKFDIEIRKKLYNETKNIITTYFIKTSDVDMELYNIEFDDYSDFFEAIKLNYNIVKLLELKELLYKISNQLRRDIKIEDINVVNSIRGRLNIRKYIRTEYLNVHTKKYFPCRVLKEDYNIIENKFLLLIVQYAFKLINDISISDKDFIKEFYSSGHWDKLVKLKKELFKLLHSGDFKLLIEENMEIGKNNCVNLINKILPVVEQKVRRREVDPKTYGEIIKWWYSLNSKIYNLDSLPLLLYNSSFDDKLFELWILEQIKNSFITDFGMNIETVTLTNGYTTEGINPLWKRKRTHIYQLKYVNDNVAKNIKIYFQKSTELMWDDDNKPKWIYISSDNEENIKYLRGNLDIVITCDDCENFDPVLIDAKNIYYKINNNKREYINPTVSDKVYKMVGYLDNFNKKAKKHNKGLGIIVFKNRESSVNKEKEYVSDMKDSFINIFTVNPNANIVDFSQLTKYILNHFGLLADRLKTYNNLKSSFVDMLESKNESEIDSKIQVLFEHVSNSINILTRGKEDDITKFQEFLEFNIFGQDIWNNFELETKKFLSQSEFLLTSLKQCSNLEYSMFAINLAKAVENEVHIKFIDDLRNYLLSRGIRNHRYFVIDNIVKDKHLAIGQIGKCLNGRLDRVIIDYIDTKTNSKDEKDFYIEKLNLIGRKLEEFSKLRNFVAHKEGITFRIFCDIRNQVLGIGLEQSLLKLIYEIYIINNKTNI